MLPVHDPDAPLSFRGRLLKPLVRWLLGGALHAPTVAAKRRAIERLSPITLPARGVAVRPATFGGVPGEWLEPRARGITVRSDAGAPGAGRSQAAVAGRGDDPVLLYLHGGGYAVGSARSYRAITSRLARGAGIRVAALDYRLAPEHPFPAALDDALAAYEALLTEGDSAATGVSGQPRRRIAVGGDSAGGNLALVLALRLRELGLPPPAALLLYSPWTDLTSSGESFVTKAKQEVMLSAGFAREMRAHYAPGRDDAEARAPLLSPLFATPAELAGLPPVLVQVGGQEILLSDARRFADAAVAAGVDCNLEEWDACWHVWQLHGGALPEADAALRRSAAFLQLRLAKG